MNFSVDSYTLADLLTLSDRFQAADAYWALCMALNVYLALFHGWNSTRMRSQEWKYLVACYGLSSVPAIVYLFVTIGDKGKIYGPATVSARGCHALMLRSIQVDTIIVMVLDYPTILVPPHSNALWRGVARPGRRTGHLLYSLGQGMAQSSCTDSSSQPTERGSIWWYNHDRYRSSRLNGQQPAACAVWGSCPVRNHL